MDKEVVHLNSRYPIEKFTEVIGVQAFQRCYCSILCSFTFVVKQQTNQKTDKLSNVVKNANRGNIRVSERSRAIILRYCKKLPCTGMSFCQHPTKRRAQGTKKMLLKNIWSRGWIYVTQLFHEQDHKNCFESEGGSQKRKRVTFQKL